MYFWRFKDQEARKTGSYKQMKQEALDAIDED